MSRNPSSSRKQSSSRTPSSSRNKKKSIDEDIDDDDDDSSSSESDNDLLNVPFKYDPDFDGPKRSKDRKCTDLPCLILFIISCLVWFCICLYVLIMGDPRKINAVSDSHGNLCGVDKNVEDKPYLFYLDIRYCQTNVNSTSKLLCASKKICVKECPNHFFYYDSTKYKKEDVEKIKEDMICMDTVNKDNLKDLEDIQQVMVKGDCSKLVMESEPIHDLCIPTEESMNDVERVSIVGLGTRESVEELRDVRSMLNNILSDVKLSIIPVGIGLCIATLLAILILFFLTVCTVGTVVTLIVLSITISLLIGMFCIFVFLTTYSMGYLVSGILAMVGCFFWSFIFCLYRKTLCIAIHTIKEATKAVKDIKSSIFYPIIPYIIQMLVFATTIATNVIVVTLGEKSFEIKGETYGIGRDKITVGQKCDPEKFLEKCQHLCLKHIECAYTYNIGFAEMIMIGVSFFIYLWIMFFITATNEMVMGGAFAMWYWLRNKKDLPYYTISISVKRVVRFHMGTTALGSFFVAVVEFIKTLIERQRREMQEEGNLCAMVCFICLEMCIQCLQELLKYINRNAYILCSVHAMNFCKSGKMAFYLLKRNILKVIVVTQITEKIFMAATFLILLIMLLISYIIVKIFENNLLKDVYFIWIPIGLTVFGSLLISTAFFSVYDMAIDSIFICFLEDMERNDGSSKRPYFMSRELIKLLQKDDLTF